MIRCAGLRWCSNPLAAAAQMRRFEKQGMTREQAEALTEHMTELICTNREKIVEQFVSKAALEKVVALQGSFTGSIELLALACLNSAGGSSTLF